MTESMQVAFVVNEEEQQQEEGEVHKEEVEDKEAQDSAQAEQSSHHEDGIATNIQTKEVPSRQILAHANNPF